MINTIARVIIGFTLASLTAGLVQVLFVMTPVQLLTSPSDVFAQRAGETGLLALLAATHAAIFAAIFALIAVAIGEWMGINSLTYYLAAGATIALLGFLAQFSSEMPGQPTIFNNYALKAFLTSGFFAGLIYWLVSGQRTAGEPQVAASGTADTSGIPAPKSWKNRPRIVVEEPPKGPAAKPVKKPSLSEMLAEADKDAAAKPAAQKADTLPEKAEKPAPAADAKVQAATSVPSTKTAASNETPAKKS